MAALSRDPVAAFNDWLEEARAGGTAVPEAMTLATVDESGQPSARMLLLNPRAALVFYWQPLGRQVRVEGTVRRLSPEESDAYWATRPVRSRAAAAASRQSEPLASLEELEAEAERLLREHDGDVPRPGRWGGYVLEPHTIELWQHRDDRLHERLVFTRAREGWRREQLAP